MSKPFDDNDDDDNNSNLGPDDNGDAGEEISITVDDERLLLGTAADSGDLKDERLSLHRLFRYGLLSDEHSSLVEERLAAEINQVAPKVALEPWLIAKDYATGALLAEELDRLATAEDRAILRSLSDCVRLLSLPAPHIAYDAKAYWRVTAALFAARKKRWHVLSKPMLAEVESFLYGWAAAPLVLQVTPELQHYDLAVDAALGLGHFMVTCRIQAAQEEVRNEYRHRDDDQTSDKTATSKDSAPDDVPEDHVMVCSLPEQGASSSSLTRTYKSAINSPLPLTLAPPLPKVRATLLFEFPYAQEAIDAILSDLIGQRIVRLKPTLLVGQPGAGKSRFARRLAEELGLIVWRVDGAQSDGSIFAGTDRRWHSTEPCHPFMAVHRAAHANPLVLIDELEKAATRSDHGRLWDCLLGFFEPETAARYPDPALQTTLDLSHVNYVMTANSTDALPSPLRDRLRIINFPTPQANDLDQLLPAVLAGIAIERQLDPRWITPLNGDEYHATAYHWRGGSVRQLKRIVEVILKAREKNTVPN
ncbi:AAA family ATPase [Afipia sp. 1NLS2]|uniref:AAA family ATPase n=1 Tax=Afipia sp. 1NLS2 TaxID=666684 RepID=UPI0001D9E6ED|nr:AAA family ATPase [Afipia sp. 1NLS2]EFI51353.1 AAA ATPase [Afipia sp. 1NLS2]